MSRSIVRLLMRVLTLVLVPALVQGGLLVTAPAQAQKIYPNFWGMHDNDWTSGPSVPVGAANFTTSGTYWRSIETSRGHFDWRRLDAQVKAAEAIHARPMVLLGQTPKFHSSRPGSRDYYAAMPNRSAWRNYVSKVVSRYGSRLDYQIWPEPNIIQNWTGTPGGMALLTKDAAALIRKKARKAKIISPAVALRLKAQRTWAVGYFKALGGAWANRNLSAVAIDPFPVQRGTPENSFTLMNTIRKQLARVGVRKPFWNNEINYGVAGGFNPTSTTYSVSKQQSYLVRTYVLSAAARMQRTYWLAWFQSHELAVDMTNTLGVPLPPATSYRVVHRWLNGTNFQGCTKSKTGVWVCTARLGSREVRRIYWKPTGRAAIKTVPTTMRLENQNGNVSRRWGSRKLRLDYRPIMVASRK